MAGSVQRRLPSIHSSGTLPYPAVRMLGGEGASGELWDNAGFGGLSAGVVTRLGHLGKCGHSGGRGRWP